MCGASAAVFWQAWLCSAENSREPCGAWLGSLQEVAAAIYSGLLLLAVLYAVSSRVGPWILRLVRATSQSVQLEQLWQRLSRGLMAVFAARSLASV